jgi:hypothetical protein
LPGLPAQFCSSVKVGSPPVFGLHPVPKTPS